MLPHIAACALTVAFLASAGSDDPGDTEVDAETTTSSTLADAELFTDPQGSYEIEVDRDWDAQHGIVVAEMEVWIVGDPTDGFAPNVNVLTQIAPDMDLPEYLDFGMQEAPSLMQDFELVHREVVDGTADELGVLEYTGSVNGRPLHFLQTVGVRDGTAVVATLTAPPDVFDDLRPEIEPYLLTLRSA